MTKNNFLAEVTFKRMRSKIKNYLRETKITRSYD